MKIYQSAILTGVLALNGVIPSYATQTELHSKINNDGSTLAYADADGLNPGKTKAVSGDLSQQVSQLQASLAQSNEKIALLTADQQKAAQTVSNLQADLHSAYLVISHLTNGDLLKSKSGETRILRTANGHGR